MKLANTLAPLAAIAIAFLAGCSSTPKVKNVWTQPDIGSISFSKVMLIAATPDGSLRRTAEDAMRKAVPGGVETVASYDIITSNEKLKNSSVMLREARDREVDGIVVMRPLGKNTEINYSPGMAYPDAYWSFGSYYRPAWGLSAYYDPGYITTDTVVGIETNIYDVESGNLIWSGTTQIRNPNDVAGLVKTNAEAVLAKMREQELIP